MAYDPNSPAQTHNGFADLDAIRENTNQLRKFEAAASEPSNLVAGMFWLDTSATPYVLKQRNAANNAWLSLWTYSNLPIQQPSSPEQGDMLYYNGSVWTRMVHGILNQFWISGGHGANPGWGGLPADSVVPITLKTGTSEVGGHTTGGINANYTLPGGNTGFYPRIKGYGGSLSVAAYIAQAYASTSYACNIKLTNVGEGYDCGAYAEQRYVTASGKEHWLFVVVQKATGKIIHGYSAPDHPSFGNGDNPAILPHPFPDFMNGVPEGLEIVLMDIEDTMKIKEKGLVRITDELNIELAKEEIFKPRDMDGKTMLAEKHNSYSIRKIKN